MTNDDGGTYITSTTWDQYVEGWAGITATAPASLSVYLRAHSSGLSSVVQTISLKNAVNICASEGTQNRRYHGLTDISAGGGATLTTGRVVHRLGVHGTVPMKTVPTNGDNIVWRIIERVADAYREVLAPSLALPRVDVTVTKRIPLSAGLGSKAADAAAALVAADRFFGYHFIVRAMGFSTPAGVDTSAIGSLPAGVLRRIGREVCPDESAVIDLVLDGGTSIMRRDHDDGDESSANTCRRTPLLTRGPYWWVVAVPMVLSPGVDLPPSGGSERPGTSFETEDIAVTLCERVMNRLTDQRAEMALGKKAHRRVGRMEDLERALVSGDPSAVACTMGSDLQPAAISVVPSLRRVIQAGDRAGALGALVANQGPACALLCMDEAHAESVHNELMGSGAVRMARIASSHAPGDETGTHIVSHAHDETP